MESNSPRGQVLGSWDQIDRIVGKGQSLYSLRHQHSVAGGFVVSSYRVERVLYLSLMGVSAETVRGRLFGGS